MLFYFSDNFEITAVPERIMTDDWTEPVRGLWQHLLLDFSAEQDFNVKISQKLPHCSICALFKPLQVSFGIASLLFCLFKDNIMCLFYFLRVSTPRICICSLFR